MMRSTFSHRPATSRCRARGATLFEGLVALAVLAFGLLGMLRFQSSLVSQGTEAQSRVVAAQLGDELLNLAIVDPGNAGCYTLPEPEPGKCSSPQAADQAKKWEERARKALPGKPTAKVVEAELKGSQLVVTLKWQDRAKHDETHTLKAVTDVRL